MRERQFLSNRISGGGSAAGCEIGSRKTLCSLLRLSGWAASWLTACGLAAFGLAASAAWSQPAHRLKPTATSLTGQQRVLHALDRFTFGPAPGEAGEVERIGLNRWFDLELHPDRISDAALDARLAQYPAMQLPQAELFAHFPPRGAIRQYVNRGTDHADATPAEQAIYADAAFRYQERRALKATNAAANTTVTAAAANTTTANGTQLPAAPAGAASEPATPDQIQPMGEAQVRAVLNLPPDQRLQQLIAFTPEQMLAFDKGVKGGLRGRLTEGLDPAQVETVEALARPEQVVDREVTATRLLRDVYSQRQLQAVMADFWLNHFNVYVRKDGDEPYLLPSFFADAVLPHALGRFEDLLVATAESPAMLVYLDNWKSIGPDSPAAQRAAARAPFAKNPGKRADAGINENYARELMELHTVGVNGGYTQADVIEVAKCFTGWTVAPGGGGFVFDPRRHEPGPKLVLGHTIPAGGVDEGLAVLHLLAGSPAAAHFLSTELAERFVSDTPPPALVRRMTAAYLHSGGDIAAVLTAMFHSPEFWSPAYNEAKVKTPLQFVVSALRASGAEIRQPMPLVQAVARLGMPIYGMQTPNGYSWQAADWINTGALLNRMNFALTLSSGRLPGTAVSWTDDAASTDAGSPDDLTLERTLEASLLGHPASAHTHNAVLESVTEPDLLATAAAQFNALPTQPGAPAAATLKPVSQPMTPPHAVAPEPPAETMAGLLLGSPEFQRY